MKTETFEHDGIIYSITIGKNANENSEIVNNACESDIWFHVSDLPSCHLILKTAVKINQIPRQVIKKCAYLCKINTTSIKNKCNVIYTNIANVKVTKIPGQVTTTQCKSVGV